MTVVLVALRAPPQAAASAVSVASSGRRRSKHCVLSTARWHQDSGPPPMPSGGHRSSASRTRRSASAGCTTSPSDEATIGFFRIRRTVSYETWTPPACVPNCSANKCNVQRSRPFGGSLQARAVSRASCAPSTLPGTARCRRSSRAASTPSVAARCRTRSIVGTLRAYASAIAASVQPGPSSPWSATKRTRARVVNRLDAFGWRAASARSSRSASERETVYILTIRRHSRRWDALSLSVPQQPFKSNVKDH